ncbi:MAG TPA: hypothetical protein VFE46_10770 [Pirellulales bacterium]|jgi:hypothetical protein|nr:hypothetical protein [Pirellulales bacterium]
MSRAEALDNLSGMIAASKTFRVACAPANSEDRIFSPYVADPASILYPRVVIGLDGLRWMRDAGGDQNYLLPQGGFKLWFYDSVRDTDPSVAIKKFLHYVDSLIYDLASISGQNDYLSIVAITEIAQPVISNPTTTSTMADTALQPYCFAAYRVEWNPH